MITVWVYNLAYDPRCMVLSTIFVLFLSCKSRDESNSSTVSVPSSASSLRDWIFIRNRTIEKQTRVSRFYHATQNYFHLLSSDWSEGAQKCNTTFILIVVWISCVFQKTCFSWIFAKFLTAVHEFTVQTPAYLTVNTQLCTFRKWLRWNFGTITQL